IVGMQGDNLAIDSTYAGRIAVPWKAVTALETSGPIDVGLKDGQIQIGEVSGTQNQFAIRTRDAGTVTVARDSIAFVRSPAEQVIQDDQVFRLEHPRLSDLWTGFVELNYAQSSGNSETGTLNVNASATRQTSRDKIAASFTSLYSRTDTNGISA